MKEEDERKKKERKENKKNKVPHPTRFYWLLRPSIDKAKQMA